MSTPNASQCEAYPVFRLPDSVWESIIGRLKAHHRANLRGACRKFKILVNNAVTKIKVDPSTSEDVLAWQLHSRFPSLEHLEVIKPSDVDCFTDTTLAQLALKDLSHLTGLTSFNLEHCTQMTVAGMASLALACPRISKLVVPQVCQLCMSDAILMVLSRLPDLTKLRVQCCKHCNEVAMAYLCDLKRLTALELEDYGQALRQVTLLTTLTSLRSVMVWSDYTLDVGDHGPGAAGAAAGHHGGPGGVVDGAGPGAGGAGGGEVAAGAVGGGAGEGPGGGQDGADLLLFDNEAGFQFHPHIPPHHHHQHNHQHPHQHPHNHHQHHNHHHGLPGLAGGAGAGLGAVAQPPAGMNAMMAAAEVAAAAVANLNLLHLHQVGAGAEGAGAAAGADGAAAGGVAGAGGNVPAMVAAAVAAAEVMNDEAFAHQLQLTEQVLSNIFQGKAALLDWVTGMTGLTHVDIQRVDVQAADLQRFTALPGLVHLGVGDLNLETSWPEQEYLPPLPSVTKLVSHNITHESLLRSAFPALRALSCDSSDTGLKHVGELTSLVNLFLWNSPTEAITDVGLAALSGLRRLETFRLEGSETVSNNGWVRFAEAHSELTRIDMIKCPLVTDIGLILSIPKLTRLRRVSFVDCPGIDTASLAALLAFCPGLEHLELQDCTCISLASLRALLATVSRPDLDLVYRRGGSMRVLHGGR